MDGVAESLDPAEIVEAIAWQRDHRYYFDTPDFIVEPYPCARFIARRALDLASEEAVATALAGWIAHWVAAPHAGDAFEEMDADFGGSPNRTRILIRVVAALPAIPRLPIALVFSPLVGGTAAELVEAALAAVGAEPNVATRWLELLRYALHKNADARLETLRGLDADFDRWLDLVPTRDGPAGAVVPADYIQMVLSAMCSGLVHDGEVEGVRRLVEAAGWRRELIGEAQRARAARDSTPPSLEEIAGQRAPLRSSPDLLRLVVQTLDDIQTHDVDGDMSVRTLFYDVGPDEETKPRHETRAYHLLGKLFCLRLGSAAHVALEIQTSEGNNRCDIDFFSGTDLRVRVEVKWDHLHVRQRGGGVDEQLARYLNEMPAASGLYLVLWQGRGTGDPALVALEIELRTKFEHMGWPKDRARWFILRLGGSSPSAS